MEIQEDIVTYQIIEGDEAILAFSLEDDYADNDYGDAVADGGEGPSLENVNESKKVSFESH